MTVHPVAPTRPAHALAHLNDVDRLLAELDSPEGRAATRRVGFEPVDLTRVRALRLKLAQTIDSRWLQLYERLAGRYPRAIAAVRAQVCTGCFVTLPPTARGRAEGEEAAVCPGCGRLLLWV